MKKRQKKLLTWLMLLILIAGMIPVIPVDAAETKAGSVPLRSTVEEVAADLRAGMVNREESIAVGYKTSDFSGINQAFVESIFDKATEHTGNPKEGDYLYWQFDYTKTSMDYEVTFGSGGMGLIFTFNIQYYTTADQELEVDALVEDLISTLDVRNMTNDYMKLKAIYEYLCENVTYDETHRNDSSYTLQHTAYAALKNKTASCRGFSTLLYRLALELGIDSRLIVGTTGGQYHTWNLLQLDDDLYYNTDATYDSHLAQQMCFLKCDANMPNHSRKEEYATAEFYNTYPMGKADYVYQETEPDVDPDSVASGTTGNLKWTLNKDGQLNISGQGQMENFKNKTAMPWYDYKEQITSVVLEDGIISIGDLAFYGMTNLEKVSISKDVTTIGAYSFKECVKLDGVVLPEGLTQLGESAFYGCSSLTAIEIPDSLWTIRPFTFKNCASLQTVKLKEGNLMKISEAAFYGTNIKEIAIPKCVDIIDVYAFKNCKNLVNVTIPEGDMTELRSCVFHSCIGLSKIVIPKNIAKIGDYCFSGSWNLWQIYFEGDAPVFGTGVFKGLAANVYYPGDNESWTSDVMKDYGGKIMWKVMKGH